VEGKTKFEVYGKTMAKVLKWSEKSMECTHLRRWEKWKL
jgi:hypothetical protein